MSSLEAVLESAGAGPQMLGADIMMLASAGEESGAPVPGQEPQQQRGKAGQRRPQQQRRRREQEGGVGPGVGEGETDVMRVLKKYATIADVDG